MQRHNEPYVRTFGDGSDEVAVEEAAVLEKGETWTSGRHQSRHVLGEEGGEHSCSRMVDRSKEHVGVMAGGRSCIGSSSKMEEA